MGLIVLAAAASASAHPLSVSYAQYAIRDDHIAAIVRLPMDDVDLLLRVDRDLDGHISAGEIEAAGGRIQAYVERHLQIRADDIALTARRGGVREWRDPSGAVYVEVSFDYPSPLRVGRISIQSDFLTDLYSTHKTLGEIQAGGHSEEFVFELSRVYERRATGGGTWRTAASFIRLGIEHIFTGYDHILFLFGLLVIGAGLRNLVAIVTSFTVAHSMTLALATLGVLQPVPWMIEAAIALSIAYIGFENLFVHNPRYRWKITFVFGLVHGLGFATVLREMHLPRAGLVVSLFSFNAGVEIGQIAIVTLMYPVLAAIARTSYRVPISRIASSAIAIIGLFWFYQRIPLGQEGRVGSAQVASLLLLAVTTAAHADIILSATVLNTTLKTLERLKQQTASGTDLQRTDALFQTGVEADHLASLINDEIASHGMQERELIELAVSRTKELGISISYNREKKKFFYDGAAFREYLKAAPNGSRAADAEFMVLSYQFYQSPGTEIHALAAAVETKKQFLARYPKFKGNAEVSLYLAIDYRDLYRLYQEAKDSANAEKYRRLTRTSYQALIRKYPGTEQADAARGLLRRFNEEAAQPPRPDPPDA